MTASDEQRCTNVNRKGDRCRLQRTGWGSPDRGWPLDPKRCTRHLTEDEKATRDQHGLLDFAAEWGGWGILPAEPACWSWPVLDEARAMLQRWRDEDPATIGRVAHATLFGDAIRLHHQGRCAICGRPGNEVEDHDHTTGLVRGWLDRGCNTSEGMNRDPGSVYGMYRRKHPYLILGIEVPYSGFGWENGKPIGAEEWPPPEHDRWRDNAMRGVL